MEADNVFSTDANTLKVGALNNTNLKIMYLIQFYRQLQNLRLVTFRFCERLCALYLYKIIK